MNGKTTTMGERHAPASYGEREQSLTQDAIITLVSQTGDESVLRWYADIVGDRCNVPHIVMHGEADKLTRKGGNGRYQTDSDDYDSNDDVDARLRCPMGFLTTDWLPEEDRLDALLRHVVGLNLPTMLVRQQAEKRIRRVVVATSRGYHALQQLWVAKEIAATLKVPLFILYLPRPEDLPATGEPLPEGTDLNQLIDARTSYLLGVNADFDVCLESNVVHDIVRRIHPDDLLIMAAPPLLTDAGHFSASMAAAVARQSAASQILFSPKRPSPVTLRRLFWGRLILQDAHPEDKEAAIALLIEALILENQVPCSSRRKLIDLAMARERAMPSAVDCQTAFPHIHLHGFRGMAGSMAICPNGVNFGSADGAPSRFIFLLVTPDGFCDEHLALQARIARRMIRPAVREALLKCASPAAVLDILEPAANAGGVEPSFVRTPCPRPPSVSKTRRTRSSSKGAAPK